MPTNKSAIAEQSISLPKGGGALKGIGETFQPNLFSGTGNHSIPIATTPGRNGFGPALTLQYSSGNGNGVFGLGWELPIPRITRKTEKGLPKYDDTDVFVMSGAEDLVPCLEKLVDPSTGKELWNRCEPIVTATHTIDRYRPRTEGLFARIERWINNTTGDVHWKAITKDNITSIYGAAPECRIADPTDPQRVYEWLLQETFDAFGNHIVYEYARDHPSLYTHHHPELGLSDIFEQNRNATQLYIRRIYYGNLPDPLVDEQGNAITYSDGSSVGILRGGRRYALEVVFDYGDWPMPTLQVHPAPSAEQELFGAAQLVSGPQQPVPLREDRFSSFRAGFEIRTLRRCRRVMMFHHFAELGGPTLVRSTDFEYKTDPNTRTSFLVSATVTGHEKDTASTYRSVSMPPVTFAYTEFRPHEQHYQSIEALGADMPPMALNNPDVSLVDLFGDGLPDVVHSGPFGFQYWRNLGGGLLDHPQSLSHVPASVGLSQPGVGFGDIGGDGQTDLLVHSGPLPGFYETTADQAWQSFKPYESFPSFDLNDPNVRLVDLTGDGRSDALMTEAEHFAWFRCLGEKGYAPPEFIPRRYDLNQFPDVYFDDRAGRVRLADMSGDGLSDIILIHNGRIDYWPNLGYGRFGPRITMANSPQFEVDFDPRRLFLADLNGTGCADLVYVDFDRVRFWFNQSGNQWSLPETILGTPPLSNADSIQFADVFGTGTATLVWSKDYAAQPESHYKALDFCGGIKPYVLNEMSNNMGATTRVRYAPSTKYFLEDQANGTPWITRLPFPVQVVDKVEVIDHISKTKLVTTYKYHHGYYDGREREFRGFGRVDQFDTETFEDFTRSSLHGAEASFINDVSAYHVPPVEIRSWFHTGIYFDEDSAAEAAELFDYRELTERFRGEYYQGDIDAIPLGEHEVTSSDAPHETYRALRGAIVRTEMYARDGSAKARHPYLVTENRHRVVQIQPKDGNHHGVYFSHHLESLSYHYERNPTDPRVSHALTLEVDDFGNVLKSIAIGYGRRLTDPDLPTQADREEQTQTLVTYTENGYTNKIDDPTSDLENYRTPQSSESRTYELTGFAPAISGRQFILDQWQENGFALLNNAESIAYEATADPTRQQKRLIEHVRTYYRKNDLTALLPLGVLESLALPGESYKLAFTPELLTDVYGNRVTDAMMESDGGYVHTENDSNWWIHCGRSCFSPGVSDTPAVELNFARQHFFLPHQSRDPFGNAAFVRYDAYDLLPIRTTDPLGNQTRAALNYRLMQPFLVTDPNCNRTEVAFDTLGLVVGTALMGKETETKGDSLIGFCPELTSWQRQSFLVDPLATAADLLQGASTRIVYDLDCFRETGQPVFTAALARETHLSDPLPVHGLKVQISLNYSDGFGREIQKKIQAEAGPAPQRDANGKIITGMDGQPVMTPTDLSPRWVGSGWTIFNNKGKPVRQYEPFFTDYHRFEFDVRIGVSPVLFYDPLARMVATLHPNHTWEKVIFDPWRKEAYDVNDTVLNADGSTDPKSDENVKEFFSRLPDGDYLPTWYEQRIVLPAGDPEQMAAAKAAGHRQTPAVAQFDSLGRIFLTVAHNRFEHNNSIVEEKYPTRVELDIEGNQRAVRDAVVQNGDLLGRVVMRYGYDMLSTQIHQSSMEAGERWMLNDVMGKPIRAWDSRGFTRRIRYDELRRPTGLFVTENGTERLAKRTVYGESEPTPETKNLRGKLFQIFDAAGVVTNEEYDFKGNLRVGKRDLLADYKTAVDWQQNPARGYGTYINITTYDALNRPLTVTTPDGSVYCATFNEANLLEKVDVNLRGAATRTSFVINIDYNAKGQREFISYGNGAKTAYEYDPLTFRMTRLRTIRAAGFDVLASQLFADTTVVQDLRYTYDPAGNIIRIADTSLARLSSSVLDNAPSDYTYDAIYRLIEATGREHIGQTAHDFTPQNRRDYDFKGLANFIAHPNDLQAMGRYTERYRYDEAGNFQFMRHIANGSGWTRDYEYNAASLIEAGKQSNRVTKTTANGFPEAYTYTDRNGKDVNGCITAINSMQMHWDFKDQLQKVDLGGGGTAYYVYDCSGERVRKVIERQGGVISEERIYLGGFEIYRKFGANALIRETLHVMDDKQHVAVVETKTSESGNVVIIPVSAQRYQFGNHLGSVSLELDKEGALISYEEYHPYGTTAFQAMDGAAEVSLKRYRYTDMERDEETGFTYHGARYYSPWTGHWTSPDPSFLSDGINLYAYVSGNPIRQFDPNGRDGVSDFFTAPVRRISSSPAHKSKVGDFIAGWYEAEGDMSVGLLLGAYNELKEKVRASKDLNSPIVIRHLSEAGPSGGADDTGLYNRLNEKLNPAYGALCEGYEVIQAITNRDYRSIGYHSHNAAVNILQTIGIASAVAKVVTPKLPGANPGTGGNASGGAPQSGAPIGGSSNPTAPTPSLPPIVSEGVLRARIVDRLEAVKTEAYQSAETALKKQDKGFFERLGLTQKQINSILEGTSQYERSFGTAVEMAMEKAIRADEFLSRYVEYTANGKVPMGVGKPDWIIATAQSRIPVDLSTSAQAATRLRQLGMFSQRTKWFTEGGLNLTYKGAPPRPTQ